MAERPTLLARNSNAPTTQPTQTGAVQGAFGDYHGLTALGQGLSSAGTSAMDYANTKAHEARSVRDEMDRRRMQDHQLKASNLIDTAVLGVRKKWEAALSSGEKIDDPYSWMEQNIAEARSGATELLDDVAGDPLFQKAVPKAAMDQHWLKATDNLLIAAAQHEGQVRMQDRLDTADVFVGASFSSTVTGKHAEVLTELGTKAQVIDGLQIPRGAKNQLRRQLADRAYDKTLAGIQAGVPAPESALTSPLFNPGQQRMLAEFNAKLSKPVEIKPGEATKVLESTLETALKTADLSVFTGETAQTMQMMASAISAAAVTEDAKRYPFAQIELAKKEIELTRNNFNDGALKGTKLYQRLTTLSASMSDPKTAEALYDSLGIKGAQDTDRSRFMTNMKAKVEEQLNLINTGKANVLIDRSDAVAPVAASVTADFNLGALTRQEAQRYTATAREQYKQLGIPENLQVLVPAAVAGTVIDRVWNGDNNNAVRMMTDIGSNFGSEALGSIANHFLAPTNAPKTGGSVDGTKARAGAYAALFKVAAADHARTEIGASSRELDPFLKTWMDDLSNFEKNQHTFPMRSRSAAEKVFNRTSFNDPANAKEVIGGEQFYTIKSTAQSLPGIALGLFWQHGQNNDLATGFKELTTRIIQSRAYSAGTQGQGADEYSQETVAVGIGDDINKALAGIYTVVPSAGVENTRRVYDLWPTKLVKEGAFATPKNYGAADAADMSNQLSNVLRNVGYYEPRKNWDRGTWGNAGTYVSNALLRENPLLAPFMQEGSASVAELPIHLSVDWAKVDGIVPAQTNTGGKDLFRDYVTNPKTKFTMNSVAFTQNGAWRYNWRTGDVEALIFPARSTTPAGPSVETPGAAQPLMYNYGSAEKPLLRPVSIKAEDIRKFDTAYRRGRVDYLNNGRADSSKVTEFMLNNTMNH